MARAPYGQTEQHVDHLPLVHSPTPHISVQFNYVVTARYSGLKVARFCAQRTGTNDRNLAWTRADSIALIEAFRQVLMPMETERDTCIYEQLEELRVEIIVQCRAARQIMMPSRCHQPTRPLCFAQHPTRFS